MVHLELAREIARRFNYLYGREPDFEALAEEAIDKLGKKNAAEYRKQRKLFQETGDEQAMLAARLLVTSRHNLSMNDQERLLGYWMVLAKPFYPNLKCY